MNKNMNSSHTVTWGPGSNDETKEFIYLVHVGSTTQRTDQDNEVRLRKVRSIFVDMDKVWSYTVLQK